MRTLRQVLRRYGPVSPRRWPQLAIILGAALARWPFTAWEKRRAPVILAKAPPMKPPIFILGHWRSGTTHLYNLLSQSQQFSYVPPVATGLPWDLFGIVRLLRPLLERGLPEHRFIDNVAVTPDAPQEDEAAIANMSPASFYHALYFPRRFREAFLRGVFFDNAEDDEIASWRSACALFLAKIAHEQPGRRLVVKNPTYTARVAMIREMWPDAQFIHIRRNPYVVFHSMRNFHLKLCAALGLQTDAPGDVDAVVLETYARMMDALDRDTADLPPDRFIDLRFEDLETAPIKTLEAIYARLGWSGFDADRIRYAAYLDGIAGYRKNSYRFTDADMTLIGERWSRHIAAGGYAPPV